MPWRGAMWIVDHITSHLLFRMWSSKIYTASNLRPEDWSWITFGDKYFTNPRGNRWLILKQLILPDQRFPANYIGQLQYCRLTKRTFRPTCNYSRMVIGARAWWAPGQCTTATGEYWIIPSLSESLMSKIQPQGPQIRRQRKQLQDALCNDLANAEVFWMKTEKKQNSTFSNKANDPLVN